MGNPLVSPKFTIISDLDDTLKITHTTNHMKTVVRGLFFHQAYTGMSELFQEWLKNEEPFFLVSSSPQSIRKKILRFLKKNNFPTPKIILRDWFKQPDVRKYKTETLRNLAQMATSPIIFLGDDSEWDPEVFSKIRNDFPNKVTAIYIRKVRGRPLPEGVTGFHTAFEIAFYEHQAGRLSIPQASRVGKAILDQKHTDFIIPYFVMAPFGLPLPDYLPLQTLMNRINDKLIDLHAKRQLIEAKKKS